MELASSRKIVAYSDFDSVRKCARLIEAAAEFKGGMEPLQKG